MAKPKAKAGFDAAQCSARDWPEDFADENGKYQCQCIYCAEYFIGHKRRFICKLCDGKPGEVVTSAGSLEHLVRPRWLVCDTDYCDYEVHVECADTEVAKLEKHFGFVKVGNQTLCRRAHAGRTLRISDRTPKLIDSSC